MIFCPYPHLIDIIVFVFVYSVYFLSVCTEFCTKFWFCLKLFLFRGFNKNIFSILHKVEYFIKQERGRINSKFGAGLKQEVDKTVPVITLQLTKGHKNPCRVVRTCDLRIKSP